MFEQEQFKNKREYIYTWHRQSLAKRIVAECNENIVATFKIEVQGKIWQHFANMIQNVSEQHASIPLDHLPLII